jgi:plasmid stability protein
LETETIAQLKARAKRHGRSLQGEVKVILIDATAFSLDEAQAASKQWQQRLRGRVSGDSAVLLREDRER